MNSLIACVFRNDLNGAKAETLQLSNVDARNGSDRTALTHAAIDGKLDFVKLLVQAGADVNTIDSFDCSPLHYAAQGYFPEIVALLIEHGAIVDAEDNQGNTPLGVAVFESCGRGEVIRILLRAGADPEHCNKHGQTPIGLASLISNYDVKQHFSL